MAQGSTRQTAWCDCRNNQNPVKPFPLQASFQSCNCSERSAKAGSPFCFADKEAETKREGMTLSKVTSCQWQHSVAVSLVDSAPGPLDPLEESSPGLVLLPLPRAGPGGQVPLPSSLFMPSVAHVSLEQCRCILLHVEGQAVGLIDRLSWGDGGPWTEGWQQKGQQAEGGWQKKSEVSTESLTPPAYSFILQNNSSNGCSPYDL